MKRYNLVLPEELWTEIQAIADRDGTTAVEVIRRWLKLGLLAEKGEVKLSRLGPDGVVREVTLV